MTDKYSTTTILKAEVFIPANSYHYVGQLVIENKSDADVKLIVEIK